MAGANCIARDEAALALEMGTPLQSHQGLDRLSTRAGDIGALARWLRTDQAKTLEQEELDPKVPDQTSYPML